MWPNNWWCSLSSILARSAKQCYTTKTMHARNKRGNYLAHMQFYFKILPTNTAHAFFGVRGPESHIDSQEKKSALWQIFFDVPRLCWKTKKSINSSTSSTTSITSICVNRVGTMGTRHIHTLPRLSRPSINFLMVYCKRFRTKPSGIS